VASVATSAPSAATIVFATKAAPFAAPRVGCGVPRGLLGGGTRGRGAAACADDESRGRRRSRAPHGKLLEGELITSLQEGREGTAASKMAANGDKSLVQTSDEIEDEGAVADGFSQISEVVGGGLEKLAVVGDG